MEFILLGALVKIGFGFTVVATLGLLAMHAFENRSQARVENDTSRKPVDAGEFRLHHFPRVKHAEAARNIEEPTQRAA